MWQHYGACCLALAAYFFKKFLTAGHVRRAQVPAVVYKVI